MVPLSPCKELSNLNWTFWRSNSIILMPQTKTISASLSINFNSRIYFLNLDNKLFEIYKYNLQDKNHVEKELGSTNLTNFLKAVTYIWDRRANLRNIHLNMIYNDYPPFSIKQNDTRVIKGYHGELFHFLQETLQFSYNIFFQEDRAWGTEIKNGTYNGMLGKILHGNINWGVSDFTMTNDRSLLFDFSIPILDLPKQITTRHQSEEFDTFTYLEAFSKLFWFCVIFTAVVLVISMYWTLRLCFQNR